jgi:hypothetical protein
MPNQPSPELFPEHVDAQVPSGTRLRFCFDEPLMTSDAGLLLLAEHVARNGDIARIAAALAPRLKAPPPGARKSRAPEHSKQELLTQHIMQLIGGFPDGNESNLLRHHSVLQMLVGKAAPGTADATLASQPTMSRRENGLSLRQLVRAFDAMVGKFIASYLGKEPAGFVLDLDPTDCIVYGQHELGMFSIHVGDTCVMPFHLYKARADASSPPPCIPARRTRPKPSILHHVGKKLRQVWPQLPLVFRAQRRAQNAVRHVHQSSGQALRAAPE